MSKKITAQDFIDVSKQFGIEVAILKMFWEVESSGSGFASDTGKIIIQFEPEWFKKLFVDWKKSAPGKLWVINEVEVQSKEWKAFASAYGISQKHALMATSIGAPQIMGFHYKRLGFATVDEMWKFFDESEKNQLIGLVKFILTDKKLLAAVKSKNFHLIATYYNGAGYLKFAAKHKTVPYNIKLEKSYKKHSA